MKPIDPQNITDTQRSDAQLEQFLLFAISVAGKRAAMTSSKLDQFLAGHGELTPFEYLQAWDATLLSIAERVRLGQYKRIVRAFREVVKFKGKLRRITFDDLVGVFGIGPKTANFFLLHSREGYSCAVLDTHILRWMRETHGVATPKTTPSGKRYHELAEVCQQLMAKSYPDRTMADADLEIWKMMSTTKKK
jgi:thermostable 8-oxoguanine DNA glycosylase